MYRPGYGYVTSYGSGFWQDAGTELITNVGKKVASAIGDRIGNKIADKIVSKKKPTREALARETFLKKLELLPSKKEEYGLPEDVRKALYNF